MWGFPMCEVTPAEWHCYTCRWPGALEKRRSDCWHTVLAPAGLTIQIWFGHFCRVTLAFAIWHTSWGWLAEVGTTQSSRPGIWATGTGFWRALHTNLLGSGTPLDGHWTFPVVRSPCIAPWMGKCCSRCVGAKGQSYRLENRHCRDPSAWTEGWHSLHFSATSRLCPCIQWSRVHHPLPLLL